VLRFDRKHAVVNFIANIVAFVTWATWLHLWSAFFALRLLYLSLLRLLDDLNAVPIAKHDLPVALAIGVAVAEIAGLKPLDGNIWRI
jgi:hypothetical protein